MKFKSLLMISAITLLSACAEQSTSSELQKTASSATTKMTKPNIVFIFADDQSTKTIGAYGNKEISTPNLDKLAAQGVNFSNAHNMGAWTGAVCLSSRTMLNSGLSLWQAYSADTNYKKGIGEEHTWSKLMEKAGYDTYMTGKWHVAANANRIFNTVKQVRPGMPKDHWDHHAMVKKFAEFEAGTSPYKTYQEFLPVGYNRPLSREDHSWSPTDTSQGGYYQGGKHWSEAVKDNAIEFIAQAKQKDTPFFMYLAFNAPHDPRQAPQEFQDLYDAEKLSLPKNFLAEYPEKDFIGNGPSLRDAALAPFPRTEYATRVHLKEYYALVSHLDKQVGEVIAALKASGKMDNTYIIYTADHGLAVGEHGLFGKQNMYDDSIKPPFIIWGPDIKGGQVVDANIYLQDAMATALELAGVQDTKNIFFHSLIDLAKGQSKKSHYDAMYGAYLDNQRMIKKAGFKLLVYPQANVLKLFDLKNDPDEMNNLIHEKQYQSKIKAMFADLLVLQKDLEDPLDLSAMYNALK